MSLAETQRASSAVSPSPGVNGLVLAPLHLNVNWRGQKKEEEKKGGGVCLSQWSQIHSLKTNGWESLGFQSQE